MTPGGVPKPFARVDGHRGPVASFLVAADAHVSTSRRGTWKGFHAAADRLRDAVRWANALDVDATVLAGDVTESGHPDEVAAVTGILGDLEAPLVAAPGNHDLDDGTAAFPTADGEFPRIHRVGDLSFVCLDTATDGGPRGTVGAAQLTRLDAALVDAETPVVVGHHNLLSADRHVDDPPPDFRPVTDAPRVVDALANHDVRLAFSGHAHWPGVARRGTLREVVAPPVCSYPLAALHVAVDADGTTITSLPLGDPLDREEAYQRATAGPARARHAAATGVDVHADRALLVENPPTTSATDSP